MGRVEACEEEPEPREGALGPLTARERSSGGGGGPATQPLTRAGAGGSGAWLCTSPWPVATARARRRRRRAARQPASGVGRGKEEGASERCEGPGAALRAPCAAPGCRRAACGPPGRPGRLHRVGRCCSGPAAHPGLATPCRAAWRASWASLAAGWSPSGAGGARSGYGAIWLGASRGERREVRVLMSATLQSPAAQGLCKWAAAPPAMALHMLSRTGLPSPLPPHRELQRPSTMRGGPARGGGAAGQGKRPFARQARGKPPTQALPSRRRPPLTTQHHCICNCTARRELGRALRPTDTDLAATAVRSRAGRCLRRRRVDRRASEGCVQGRAPGCTGHRVGGTLSIEGRTLPCWKSLEDEPHA